MTFHPASRLSINLTDFTASHTHQNAKQFFDKLGGLGDYLRPKEKLYDREFVLPKTWSKVLPQPWTSAAQAPAQGRGPLNTALLVLTKNSRAE